MSDKCKRCGACKECGAIPYTTPYVNPWPWGRYPYTMPYPNTSPQPWRYGYTAGSSVTYTPQNPAQNFR